MPNNILRRLRRMERSIVSNAALRSKDTKRVDFRGQQSGRSYQGLGWGQFLLNGGDDRLIDRIEIRTGGDMGADTV